MDRGGDIAADYATGYVPGRNASWLAIDDSHGWKLADWAPIFMTRRLLAAGWPCNAARHAKQLRH